MSKGFAGATGLTSLVHDKVLDLTIVTKNLENHQHLICMNRAVTTIVF